MPTLSFTIHSSTILPPAKRYIAIPVIVIGRLVGGMPLGLLRQLSKQRLGLLQVFRIKAFGEPAVDLG